MNRMKRYKKASRQLLSIMLSLTLSAGFFTACGPDKKSETRRDIKTQMLQPDVATEEETTKADPIINEKGWPKFHWDHLEYKDGFYSYEDKHYTSMTVIDVSKEQEDIDWEAVKNAGVGGCIIKAGARGYGTGKLVEDSRFKENYTGATEAGLKVIGIYFFSQAISDEEACEEADLVLKQLEDAEVARDTLVFYDLETNIAWNTGERYRNYYVEDDEIRSYIKLFDQKISQAGYTTALYSNMKWHDRSLSSSVLKGYGLWYAQYSDKPSIDKNFFIWQYSCTGHVEGITNRVDLNLMLIRKKKEQ